MDHIKSIITIKVIALVVGLVLTSVYHGQGATTSCLHNKGWSQSRFFLSAYNPPYAWHGPPYKDSVFLYYSNANFDTLLWVRDDQALMEKVHRFGFRYMLDISSLIGGDLLTGGPNEAPPEIMEDMLQNLGDVIEKYKDDPYLVGYYICDEPYPSAFHNIAVVTQRIREKDPSRPFLVNLWPYFENEIGDDDYIEYFINVTKPDLLCTDRYNFFDGWDENEEYLQQLDRIRRHALRHNLPFFFIIQAVGTKGTSVGTPGSGADEYLQWRTPSRAEHRWLVYSALTYGVHGIIWFHWDHEWGVTGNPDREKVYASIRDINAEIAQLKEIMVHLTTTNVQHTDDRDVASEVNGGNYIKTSGNASLIVGFFKDNDGNENHFMVMNKNYKTPVTVVVTLNSPLSTLEFFSVVKNQWEAVPFAILDTESKFTIYLREGGGKLFRFTKANSLGDKRAIYNEGFEAGKQFCIDNPTSCGIVASASYEAGYDKGYEDGYSACHVLCFQERGGECATFDLNSNVINIPCFFLEGLTYWLQFNIINYSPLQMELSGYGQTGY